MNPHAADLTIVRTARHRLAARIRRLRAQASRATVARCRRLEDDLAATSIRLFETENRVRELRARLAHLQDDDRALRAMQTCAILESENQVRQDEIAARTRELGAVTRKLRLSQQQVTALERRMEVSRHHAMQEIRRLQLELAEAKAARTRLEEGVQPALRKPLDAEAIGRVHAAAQRIEAALRSSRMADLAATLAHDVDGDASQRLGSLVAELAQSWSSEQARLLSEIGTLNRNVQRIVRSVGAASGLASSSAQAR